MKKIATLATALLIGANSLFAQNNNNIEAHITNGEGNPRARINLFNKLPGGIKNYTFADLKPESYFVRNINNRELVNGLSLRFDSKHSNKFTDHAGLGLQYKLPLKDWTVNIASQPVWINTEGESLPLQTAFASIAKDWDVKGQKHEWNIQLRAFGEYNLNNNQWGYGEINTYIGTEKGVWKLGLGADLYNQGTSLPQVQPKVLLQYQL